MTLTSHSVSGWRGTVPYQVVPWTQESRREGIRNWDLTGSDPFPGSVSAPTSGGRVPGTSLFPALLEPPPPRASGKRRYAHWGRDAGSDALAVVLHDAVFDMFDFVLVPHLSLGDKG